MVFSNSSGCAPMLGRLRSHGTSSDTTSPDPSPDPNRFARELFDGLPQRYDLLAEVLSFGQNGRWRAAMVDAVVPGAPARVLDVAAGTAGVSIALARRAGARVVGLDLTEAMLA